MLILKECRGARAEIANTGSGLTKCILLHRIRLRLCTTVFFLQYNTLFNVLGMRIIFFFSFLSFMLIDWTGCELAGRGDGGQAGSAAAAEEGQQDPDSRQGGPAKARP